MGEESVAGDMLSSSVISEEETITLSVVGAKDSCFDDVTSVEVVVVIDDSAKYYNSRVAKHMGCALFDKSTKFSG